MLIIKKLQTPAFPPSLESLFMILNSLSHGFMLFASITAIIHSSKLKKSSASPHGPKHHSAAKQRGNLL